MIPAEGHTQIHEIIITTIKAIEKNQKRATKLIIKLKLTIQGRTNSLKLATLRTKETVLAQ